MKWVLSLDAYDDLEEATAYYESVSPGGGDRFLERFAKAAQRVLDSPGSFPRYHGPTRICMIARSVYGIVFLSGRDRIRVVGVICLIRHPRYWTKRLKRYKADD